MAIHYNPFAMLHESCRRCMRLSSFLSGHSHLCSTPTNALLGMFSDAMKAEKYWQYTGPLPNCLIGLGAVKTVGSYSL